MRGGSALGQAKVLDNAGADGRFKFLTLRQRLDRLRLRPQQVALLPGPGGQDYDTSWSYFADALVRWRELDLTPQFARYVRVVEPLSVTLPVLFLNRERVFRETAQAFADQFLPSLADLLVALARDLGADELAPRWEQLLELFVKPLLADETAQWWDVDRVLRPALTALGHLSHALVRNIAQDPQLSLATVKHLTPLVCHPRPRIRELLAEACTGQLLRRVHRLNNQGLLRAVLFLDHSSNQGEALFEAVRGYGNRLHSLGLPLVEAIFEFDPFPPVSVLGPSIQRACRHVKGGEHANRLFEAILQGCHSSQSPDRFKIIRICVDELGSVSATSENIMDIAQRATESIRNAVNGDMIPISEPLLAVRSCLRVAEQSSSSSFEQAEKHMHDLLLSLESVAEGKHMEMVVHTFETPEDKPPPSRCQFLGRLCAHLRPRILALSTWNRLFSSPVAELMERRLPLKQEPGISLLATTVLLDESSTEAERLAAVQTALFVHLKQNGTDALESVRKTVKQSSFGFYDVSVLASARQLPRSDTRRQTELFCVVANALRSRPRSVPLLLAIHEMDVSRSVHLDRHLLSSLTTNLVDESKTVRLLSLAGLKKLVPITCSPFIGRCYESKAFSGIHSVVDMTKLALSQVVTMSVASTDEFTVKTLSFFAMGLFRTKLSLLWSSAGNLWSAMTTRSPEVAWGAMKLCMETSMRGAVKVDAGALPDNAKDLHTLDHANCAMDEDVSSENILKDILPASSDSTDPVTWHCQLLSCLTEYRHISRKEANFVVGNMFNVLVEEVRSGLPKGTSDKLLTSYTSLIEALGGLKCVSSGLEQSCRESLQYVLSRSNSGLQASTVRCLAASRHPFIAELRDPLVRLTNDKLFRDELVAMETKLRQDFKATEARTEVVDVIVRLLFGQMQGKESQQRSKRIAIARFFESSLSRTELASIVDLITQPVAQKQTISHRLATGVLQGVQIVGEELSSSLSEQSWDAICQCTVRLFQLAYSDDREEFSSRSGKRLRSLSCTCLAELIARRHVQWDLVSSALESATLALETMVLSGPGPPALLKLMAVCCSADRYRSDICSNFGNGVRQCFILLRDTNFAGSGETASALLGVLEAFVDSRTAQKDSTEQDKALREAFLKQGVALSERIWSSTKNSSQGWTDSLELLGVVKLSSRWLYSADGATEFVESIIQSFPSTSRIPNKLSSDQRRAVSILLETLAVFLENTKSLDRNRQESIVRALSPLITKPWCTPEAGCARDGLVQCLKSLEDASLSDAIAAIEDAVAKRIDRVDEPDYNRRTICFTRLARIVDEKNNVTESALLLMARQCIASCHDDDATVRGAAGYALTKLVVLSAGMDTNGNAQEVYLELREALSKSKENEIRRELSRAMGSGLRALLELSNSDDHSRIPASVVPLLPLAQCDNDPEADVFENITHIQRHRRARVLRRMCGWLESGKLDATAAFVFCHPIALHIAVEYDARKQQTVSTHVADDLVIAAIQLCGSSAARMSWSQYRKSLANVLHKFESCQDHDNMRDKIASATLQRVIVSFAESFHFDCPNSEDGGSETGSSARFVSSRLLPTLVRHLIVRTGTRKDISQFRTSLGVAAFKLMTILPVEERDDSLPRLINPVCGALGSRTPEVREAARRALSKATTILGQKYFAYLVSEVSQGLNEGFRKHVRGYTIHAILDQVNFVVDAVAACSIMRVVVDQLAGSVAEEKTVDGLFRTVREAATDKNNETILALARSVDFSDSASVLALLQPISRSLERCVDRGLVLRHQELLRHLSKGLASNESAIASDCLRFLHAILQENLPLCRRKVSNGAKADRLRASYLCEFALDLLNSLSSAGKLPEDSVDDSILSMLDTILRIVATSALDTLHDSLTLKALKVTQRLMRLPLSSALESSDSVTKRVLDVLTSPVVLSGTSAGTQLYNVCLRTAAVMLGDRRTEEIDMNNERAEALLLVSRQPIASASMHNIESQIAAVSLVRAVVSRRIVIPSVYDAVDATAKLGVQSQAAVVREMCATISLLFLLHFPLSPGRQQQHLDFYLKNLEFEHSDGRLACLAFLRGLVDKMPLEMVENESEYLFVPLASKLVSDDEACVRAECAQVLSRLVKRLKSSRKLVILNGIVSQWLRGCDSGLKIVGSNCVRVVADSGALGDAFALDLLQIIPMHCLPGATDQWDVCLGGLTALEAIFATSRELCIHSSIEGLWQTQVLVLLLHAHPLIRSAGARLLGTHLASCGNVQKTHAERYRIFDTFGLGRLYLRALCRQLEDDSMTEETVEQIGKDVLAIAARIKVDPRAGAAQSATASGPSALETTELLDDLRPMRWLTRRLCGIGSRSCAGDADRTKSGRTVCVLKVIDSLLDMFGCDFMGQFVEAIASCVFQVLESPEERGRDGNGEELRAVSETMREKLVGWNASRFFEAYNGCRSAKLKARAERKRRRAVEAVVEPELAIKRRTERNVRKRVKRGRIVEERKRRRGQMRIAKPDGMNV